MSFFQFCYADAVGHKGQNGEGFAWKVVWTLAISFMPLCHISYNVFMDHLLSVEDRYFQIIFCSSYPYLFFEAMLAAVIEQQLFSHHSIL